MPCDRITTQTVEISNCNKDILEAALKHEGWNVDRTSYGLYFYKAGVSGTYMRDLELRGNVNAADIQRAYSNEVVRQTARKFGWTVKATGNTGTLARRF